MAEKNYYVDMSSFGESEGSVNIIHGEPVAGRFGTWDFANIREIFSLKSQENNSNTQYLAKKFTYDEQGNLVGLWEKPLESSPEVIALFQDKLPQWRQDAEKFGESYNRSFLKAMQKANKTEEEVFLQPPRNLTDQEVQEFVRKQNALVEDIISYMEEIPQLLLVAINELNFVLEDGWETAKIEYPRFSQ